MRLRKFWMFIVMLWISYSVSAYDIEVDGLYYNIVSTVDRTVALTYKESVKINGYYGGYNDYSKEDLVIPTSIEYLGQTLKVVGIDIQAFEYNTSIKRLVIPSSILWLHQECFDQCTSLEEVIIEDSEDPLVFKMKGRTFYFNECPISKLYIGRNIEVPGNNNRGPFEQLSELKDVSFSGKVTSLIQAMFSDCTSLKSIMLPIQCTKIGGGAFSGCTSLSVISNTSQVTTIGGGAFINCSSLISFKCNDLKELKPYTFYNCTSLKEVELGNSYVEVSEYAFDGCKNLSTLDISKNATKICSYAFQNCTSLGEIIFPSSLTKVENYAFNDCQSLKSIIIDYGDEPIKMGNLFLGEPDKENKIGIIEKLEINRDLKKTSNRLFYFSDVKEVTIGSEVKEIDASFELSLANDLKNITIYANTPPKTNWYFYNNLLMSVKVKVPKGTKEAYQNSDSWKGFWNIEEMEISSGLTNNSISKISMYVFNNCLIISNKDELSVVKIFNLQGVLMRETNESEIHELPSGIYIVTVENQSFKIAI